MPYMKNIIFVILNVAFICSFHLILSSFLPYKRTRNRRNVVLYICFYMINTANYLFISKPILNLLGFIICYIIIIYACYEGNVKYKALIGCIVYVCSLLIEMISAYFVAILYDDILEVTLTDDNYTILIITLSKFILFVAGLMLSGRKKPARYQIKAPYYWGTFSLVPVCSVFLIVCFFLGEGDEIIYTKNVLYTISIIMIFFLNVAVYRLFDLVLKEYERRNLYENELSKVEAYEENSGIMKKQNLEMELYRHNIKKMLAQIKKFAQSRDYEAINGIVEAEVRNMYKLKIYVNTGHTELDNLINYKSDYADSLGIKSTILIMLGEEPLTYDESDLCILIGNLWDNMIDICVASPTIDTQTINFQMESIHSNVHITARCANVPEHKATPVYKKRCDMMESIVNKYHGVFSVERPDAYILADILLMKK